MWTFHSFDVGEFCLLAVFPQTVYCWSFQCFLSVSALSGMLCLPRWACLSLVSGLVSHVSLQLFGVYGGVISKSCEVSEYNMWPIMVYDLLSPLPVTVTTRIITSLVGDPNLNLHLPQLLRGGTTQCMTFHQFYPPFSAPLGPFPCGVKAETLRFLLVEFPAKKQFGEWKL